MAAYPTKVVTIAAGESLSGGVELGSAVLMGVIMPVAWDTAHLSFQASNDNVHWFDLYDVYGDEIMVETPAADYFITVFDPAMTRAVNYLKVRSGTTGTPVNQTLESFITLILVNVR